MYQLYAVNAITGNSSSSLKGPMKLFMGTLNNGTYFINVIQLIIFNQKRTQQKIIQLMNLITMRNCNKFKNPHFPLPNGQGSKSKKQRKVWIILEVYIHCIFIVTMTLTVNISSILPFEFEKLIFNQWNSAAALVGFPIEPNFQNMAWWKKVGSFILILNVFDSAFQMAASLVAVFFAAQTLQDISSHFISNMEISKIFCNITTEEVNKISSIHYAIIII